MRKAVKIPSLSLYNTDLSHVDAIGSDFILFDKMIVVPEPNQPFKSDRVTAMICTKGVTRGKINLKPIVSEGPCMVIIQPDQIVEFEYISEDLEAVFIVLSVKFLQSLNIDEKFSSFIAVRDNPNMPLTEDELRAMLSYYNMMQNCIKADANLHKLEMAKHLTIAFFYGVGHNLHKLNENRIKSRDELFVDNFLKLVQDNFKQERGVTFYADRMCLTPKYMSTAIKENSGKSAGEWIDEWVIMEAKVLLKSTNMTIQQISDELNFPSQSSFGKYFKRLVGVSPKEYRNS